MLIIKAHLQKKITVGNLQIQSKFISSINFSKFAKCTMESTLLNCSGGFERTISLLPPAHTRAHMCTNSHTSVSAQKFHQVF